MTDCNAGSYTDSGSIIYTDSISSNGHWWIGHDGYYYPEPKPENRKENDMIERQTFLDALADEGKSIGSEGREIVKEAKSDKWELFIARLLARAFENVDLAMLKEKPKEVLVTTKEA